MYIDIASLDVLDDIKRLIMIKKKPNRKKRAGRAANPGVEQQRLVHALFRMRYGGLSYQRGAVRST